MQLPNLGHQWGFRRADLTVFSISSWNLAQFPSKFLHIFKVSRAFHCILHLNIHLNIRFMPSAMHKRRGKPSKKLFWAPKYTLSQITQEPLRVILWDFLWRLRALLLMCSTQKNGTFAVVEARNAPCPMEWGCPKDRSMTVKQIRHFLKNSFFEFSDRTKFCYPFLEIKFDFWSRWSWFGVCTKVDVSKLVIRSAHERGYWTTSMSLLRLPLETEDLLSWQNLVCVVTIICRIGSCQWRCLFSGLYQPVLV